MAEYRVYVLDGGDHVIQRYEFVSESDDVALEQAKTYVDERDVELWEQHRRIGRLTQKAGLIIRR